MIDLEPVWVPGKQSEWLLPQRVPQSQAHLQGPLLQGTQPLTLIRAGGLPLALGVQSSAASIIPPGKTGHTSNTLLLGDSAPSPDMDFASRFTLYLRLPHGVLVADSSVCLHIKGPTRPTASLQP